MSSLTNLKQLSSSPSGPPASRSLQLLQEVEPVKDDRLARLLDLPRKEDLVENCVDFVEVEDEVLWT